jgi:hypothetical protein
LTLLANGITSVSLADAYDLAAFLEATGRTIPRQEWAVESIAAAARTANEGLF